MNEEKLKEWVEQKLDEGVDPERVKKSLENTGHDPSIVDEVAGPDDPFDSEPEEIDHSDEVFGDVGGENTEKDKKPEKPVETSSAGTETREEPESREETGEEEEESEQLLPDFSFSFNLPELSGLPAKKLFMVLLVALLVGGSIYGYKKYGIEPVEKAEDAVSDFAQRISSGEESQNLCPDVGVRINSIEARNGKTVAKILVTRKKTTAVLEIFQGDEKIGQKSKKFLGETTVTLNVVGDRAVLHPENCNRYSYQLRY